MRLFTNELRNWEYKLTYKNRQQGNYKIWLTDFKKKTR